MLTEYKLSQAILVYASNMVYSKKLYLQRHDVAEKNNQPVLLEGNPFTLEDLTSLCRQLFPELMADNLRFMSANVLASSGSSIGPEVWWVPGKIRPIFFENLGLKSGYAPWPSLVFVAYRNTLEVYAVKGTKRPGPETRLYVAPFPNMKEASICLGNSPVPEKCFDHEQWEKTFFNSSFSEIHETKRARTNSLIELWFGLIKSKAKQFPDRELIPNRSLKTVSELLSNLRSKNGK